MSQQDPLELSRRHFFESWALVLGGGALLSGQLTAADASAGASPETAGKVPLNVQSLKAAASVAGIDLSAKELEQAVRGVQRQRDRFQERRNRGYFANGAAPALRFDPLLPGRELGAQANSVSLRSASVPPLPNNDEAIAFSPVTHLSAWVKEGQISSERLTRIYLNRLKTYDPQLHCVVTLTEELALRQARRADEEIARGHYRGPLHGIPWGAKDLLDTKGIHTTWGAMPFKDRVADEDAFVVKRLKEAGAVLVAKLTLGALAMGDVWFDEVTRNPFDLEQGSSGSSAGSASATAAGLVGFSIGTETLGSIVSPSMRCGTTGLRPTFGRVARTGAMALCWSLDKIGPICRTVEDTVLVLSAINGADAGDPSSREHGFAYHGGQSLSGLKVGYSPSLFEGEEREIDRRALSALRDTGVEMVEVALPEEPYGSLYNILNVEAAAAFEELTREGLDDLLVRQTDHSWPNLFRQSWFVPAIEFVQADRLRRQVMEHMEAVMNQVDAVISPSFGGNYLIATNFTGHPSLTLRAGFRDNGTPSGVTLWGQLFEEGKLCRMGEALERKLGVWQRRPKLEL